MKKTPTIFKRDPNNMKLVLTEINPVCQWVFDGEGVATRKYDGSCVKINGDKYYKRREIKKGKTPPPEFIEETFDQITGKRVGWVEVDPDSKDDIWHMEALEPGLPDGTYELVGPKIQGNLENYPTHQLVKHSDATQYTDVPRSYEGIRVWLKEMDIEGLVFHHPDGRMAKIKKRDFDLERS